VRSLSFAQLLYFNCRSPINNNRRRTPTPVSSDDEKKGRKLKSRFGNKDYYIPKNPQTEDADAPYVKRTDEMEEDDDEFGVPTKSADDPTVSDSDGSTPDINELTHRD
jgi:hypothetical protein